jgi:chemotaxis response regulator CheB
MSTRILIADDDATIRLLLHRLLEKHPSWHVCGDARNGAEAIQKIDQFEPDVLVMDLSMLIMTGLQAATEFLGAKNLFAGIYARTDFDLD